MGHAVARLVDACVKSWKVVGSIPSGIIGFDVVCTVHHPTVCI